MAVMDILLKSPIENAQSRAPWIFASLIGGICAAAIIGYFDHLLKEMIVLASFIPIIIGIGGNIGTQSSSVAPGYTVDSYTTTSPFLSTVAMRFDALIKGPRSGLLFLSTGVGTVTT